MGRLRLPHDVHPRFVSFAEGLLRLCPLFVLPCRASRPQRHAGGKPGCCSAGHALVSGLLTQSRVALPGSWMTLSPFAVVSDPVGADGLTVFGPPVPSPVI
jgi:hypothetical protein